MKPVLLSGDEAVARGAHEAGCAVAAAYPGTPSTEILENLARYENVWCQWGSNEKVALAIALGASIGGARALAAMKHVGLNVAADPLLSMGYAGVNGGLVVVSADDPGCHSSQNEQDNRLYAPLAKVAMVEPSDSEECRTYIRAAFDLSEAFDTPVLFRMTTRVCHSKSLVVPGVPRDPAMKPYVRNTGKFALLPTVARVRHRLVEEKLLALEEYANTSPLNRIEWGTSREVGIITSGIAYQHAREVFGDGASYLKLGLTFPLPSKLIRTFARSVSRLYVIEEGEPYLETKVRLLGFDCIGKELVPLCGELDAGILRAAFLPQPSPAGQKEDAPALPVAPPRPPVLCAGCPHRGFYTALGKRKKSVVGVGDIGCYGLGVNPPLEGFDYSICMGSSFSSAIGFSRALAQSGDARKVFAILGDSTFFHSGIPGLVDAVHLGANVCCCILDNRITAMTGHQETPGTARDLMGNEVVPVDVVALVKATGLPEERIRVVDPLDLAATGAAMDEAIAAQGPFVIVSRRPCVLLKDVAKSLEGQWCEVDQELCRQCRQCLKIGCPAIASKEGRIVIDDPVLCTGCGLCMQVCPFGAIRKGGSAR
jgi:indolepyruvate ferredoxin oxidoreductase alpha subunit